MPGEKEKAGEDVRVEGRKIEGTRPGRSEGVRKLKMESERGVEDKRGTPS